MLLTAAAYPIAVLAIPAGLVMAAACVIVGDEVGKKVGLQ